MQTSRLEIHCKARDTNKLANPALLTADEMALMAVSRELSNNVKFPVAFGIFICSLSTKRVSVIEFVSISPPLAISEVGARDCSYLM